MFQCPMFARPMPEDFKVIPGMMTAEEKYDGHRLVMEIASGKREMLFVDKGVNAWSRIGNLRKLPTHILEAAAKLPDCYLDGELSKPGARSYGVTELTNSADLIYTIFDVIRWEDTDTTVLPQHTRRSILEDVFRHWKIGGIELAPSYCVNTWEDVRHLRDKVWARDGEGLILKYQDAPYALGKRPKNTWIKVKQCQHAVLRVIGFIPSKGEKNNRGLYAITVLQDNEGVITAVKTNNDAQCRDFEAQGFKELIWKEMRVMGKGPMQVIVNHPAIGKLLWIEYQERTPDGSYRHGMWDRWDGA